MLTEVEAAAAGVGHSRRCAPTAPRAGAEPAARWATARSDRPTPVQVMTSETQPFIRPPSSVPGLSKPGDQVEARSSRENTMSNTHRVAIGALPLGSSPFRWHARRNRPNKPGHHRPSYAAAYPEAEGPQKSGFIEAVHWQAGRPAAHVLVYTPTIANSIVWEEHNSRTFYVDYAWPDWLAWRRADLEEAFVAPSLV